MDAGNSNPRQSLSYSRRDFAPVIPALPWSESPKNRVETYPENRGVYPIQPVCALRQNLVHNPKCLWLRDYGMAAANTLIVSQRTKRKNTNMKKSTSPVIIMAVAVIGSELIGRQPLGAYHFSNASVR